MLAQLVLQACHLVAGIAGGHDEGTHAFFTRSLVGDGDDDGDIAILAAGDELLDAVDDVVATIAHGRCTQRRGIAAHMGLGQAEGPQHLALRQRTQPLLLLAGIAVLHEDGIDRAIGHADDGTGAAIASGNFLEHQRQAHIVQARTAEFLGHADAIGTERGQSLVHALGELVLFVPARGVGCDLLAHKIAQSVADHFLVLIQQHVVSDIYSYMPFVQPGLGV